MDQSALVSRLTPLSYRSACQSSSLTHTLRETNWLWMLKLADLPPTTLVLHVQIISFSHMYTHGEVEERQTGTWSLSKVPGGDAVQCKPLSQSTVCWIAKLRGVGFKLWDRTLGVPPLRQGWSQHKTEDWDKGGARVAEGKFEVHPRLGISLREKTGVCSMKSPADRARRWTIHQQANQTDLEHKGTRASDADKSAKATASAATDWPDLSYSTALLSGPEVLKRFLPGWSHHPPPISPLRSRAHWASSSATTV